MSDRERCGAACRYGFTLVELTAVFGILALIAVVAVPAFRRWVQEDDLTVATRRVEALLTLARDSAIRGGAPVSIVIDSVSGMVWLDALTSGDEVEPLALPAEAASPGAGSWTRRGDGHSYPPVAHARRDCAAAAQGQHQSLR